MGEPEDEFSKDNTTVTLCRELRLHSIPLKLSQHEKHSLHRDIIRVGNIGRKETARIEELLQDWPEPQEGRHDLVSLAVQPSCALAHRGRKTAIRSCALPGAVALLGIIIRTYKCITLDPEEESQTVSSRRWLSSTLILDFLSTD